MRVGSVSETSCTQSCSVPILLSLKEYYDIVNEARPLSGISSADSDFLLKNAFLIMKLSNLPSFKAIRALIASQWTFEK